VLDVVLSFHITFAYNSPYGSGGIEYLCKCMHKIFHKRFLHIAIILRFSRDKSKRKK